MVIYTANYGNKDRFIEPVLSEIWNKKFKFVYFTDHPFESDVWDVVVEKKTGDSQTLAKWYKINSHEVFPGEATLWMDASIRPKEDPTKFFNGWDHIQVRTHRDRKDVYEEAKVCVESKRGVKTQIEKQVVEYKKQGFLKGSGLYINGILFRKPTNVIVEMNKTWWDQIQKYSARDQISLPYVLWVNNVPFKEVEYNHYKNCFSPRKRHVFRGTKEVYK